MTMERDSLVARLTALQDFAQQPVVDDIVEKLFVDLRGRRYLKWIFSEQGDKCLIERAESGEWITGISLDVQDEIRAEWRSIAAASLAASEPELRAEIVRLQAEVEREKDAHLRLKNELVLAAYPAMDAVDAIRKWCDEQRYENDTITVARLREMLPKETRS